MLFTEFKALEEDSGVILIPRAYARMESTQKVRTVEECSAIEHYTLIIVKQIGTTHARRPGLVLVQLPDGTYGGINVYPDGRGVEFTKETKRNVYRQYDALDRLILLGFCDTYSFYVFRACYGTDPYRYNEVQRVALEYNRKQHAKRLKQGINPKIRDMTDLYIQGDSLGPSDM